MKIIWKVLHFLNKGFLEAFLYRYLGGLFKAQYESMRNESETLTPQKLDFLGFICRKCLIFDSGKKKTIPALNPRINEWSGPLMAAKVGEKCWVSKRSSGQSSLKYLLLEREDGIGCSAPAPRATLSEQRLNKPFVPASLLCKAPPTTVKPIRAVFLKEQQLFFRTTCMASHVPPIIISWLPLCEDLANYSRIPTPASFTEPGCPTLQSDADRAELK